MKSNNEITIKINVSDSLVNTLANILLMANTPVPPPFGGLPPELLALAQAHGQPPEDMKPIGFSPKGKTQ
tara:strand:+ start:2108 stop:2317 length:210 start_codon:yes stop_codon:yes gene_type:complete